MRRFLPAAFLAIAAVWLTPAAAIAQVKPVYSQNPVSGNATQQQQILVPNGFQIELGNGASLICDTGSTCPAAAGTVFGPGSSVIGDLPDWSNTGGTGLGDSGVPASNLPTSSTNNDLASYSNTTGKLGDSGVPKGNLPTSGTTTGDVASFNNTTGQIHDSGLSGSMIASGRGQTLDANPSNPTGTSSTSGVMMGLGSTCKIDPTYSGRIEFIIEGMSNQTAASSISISLRYGSGTAPANAASPTGTVIVNPIVSFITTAGGYVPFNETGIATGLTPGTTYWFDLDILVGADTGSVLNLTCVAYEF
jgi:hypothetical protein